MLKRSKCHQKEVCWPKRQRKRLLWVQSLVELEVHTVVMRDVPRTIKAASFETVSYYRDEGLGLGKPDNIKHYSHIISLTCPESQCSKQPSD